MTLGFACSVEDFAYSFVFLLETALKIPSWILHDIISLKLCAYIITAL